MTVRQAIYKSVYPFWMLFSKLGKQEKKIRFNKENKKPFISFYDLKSTLNNGGEFSFEQLKGKKILLVNTASACLYTDQYDDLEKLYQQHIDTLIVLAFPSNDFKEQEKGDDNEIAQFCKINYGVTFPLMKKSIVSKGKEQNEIFKWLTDANKNGWNNQLPEWNFSKYLVDENGTLRYYFHSAVSPLSDEVQKVILG
jgi:glutathione peroxidase